ncbi:MAG TPA: hypothetical protein VFM65_07035, partial [Flavobacteriaceae bacterium]|nr:hypothetical protein [Flavobacteriaceae bacterium]
SCRSAKPSHRYAQFWLTLPNEQIVFYSYCKERPHCLKIKGSGAFICGHSFSNDNRVFPFLSRKNAK